MIDQVGVIEQEGARIVAALAADPAARVPWSERWTVATVARHVAGTHHVVAQVIRDRPTADFGLFGSLEVPDKRDPAFPGWCTAGTAALCHQLRTTDLAAPCWTFAPQDRTVAFWNRRMAHETLVHRWDAEAALGTPAPIEPDVAVDGIDEYARLLVPFSRGMHGAAAGPTVGLVCTDVEASWYLTFTDVGEQSVDVEPVDCALTLRGPAEGVLLTLWGRLDPASAGVTLDGDVTVHERWADLIPPL